MSRWGNAQILFLNQSTKESNYIMKIPCDPFLPVIYHL